MIDLEYLGQWIGKETVMHDVAAAAPIAGLAALLDHDQSPWRAGEVPPLGHWLYFLPHVRQSEISIDGHPNRGDQLPPVSLPRRMWAGGALNFHRPLPVGEPILRRSIIRDVTAKTGKSGNLVFVALDHHICDASGALCIEERQDIVYRDVAKPGTEPASVTARQGEQPITPAAHSRSLMADPVLLFRFSALTFNAHRIHYDRDYARSKEGYPGLVLHGPLAATLLVDLFLRQNPGADVAQFEFRAKRPLFDNAPISLNLDPIDNGASLWTAGPDRGAAMTARLILR